MHCFQHFRGVGCRVHPPPLDVPLQSPTSVCTGGVTYGTLDFLNMETIISTCMCPLLLSASQEFRLLMGARLDIYCQRMLSLCGSCVNLNNCRTQHGNILHAAAKYGLAESAKEALAQGYYNMLLELDNELIQPNTWPLYYAVEEKQWSTIKIYLETLNMQVFTSI